MTLLAGEAALVTGAASGIGRLPPDVMRLLDKTNRGEVLNDRELIDAFLIASGVFDREGRDRGGEAARFRFGAQPLPRQPRPRLRAGEVRGQCERGVDRPLPVGDVHETDATSR